MLKMLVFQFAVILVTECRPFLRQKWLPRTPTYFSMSWPRRPPPGSDRNSSLFLGWSDSGRILIGTAMQFRRHFNEFVQSTELWHLSSLSAEQDRLCISEIVFESHVRLRFNTRQSNTNGYSWPLFTQGIIESFEPEQGASWAQARDILSQNIYNIIQK